MRVLWILGSGVLSGAETSLAVVLPLLRKRGIFPEVAAPGRARHLDGPTHVLPRVPWARFQVVHTHTHVFEGALAAKARGIPHVWHVRDHQLTHRRTRGRITPADQLRAMAMLSDAILACSESLRKELASLGIRSRILHHGVRVGIRAPLKGRRVACVASFFPWKGQLDLIHAMRGIKDAELVLAGGVGDRAYYLRCRNAAKGRNVRFVGHLKDVRPLLASSSVLAVPSVEALSMAALEGMAQGLPVVSLDDGGIRDVVVHGRTGFLVPIGRFASALNRLLDDPALRRRMGRAGRERVRRRFTPERLADSLEDVYLRVSRLRGSSIA